MPYDSDMIKLADSLARKKVLITYNLTEPDSNGNLAAELEGELIAAAESGIMLRPRGSAQPILIHGHQIESVVGTAVSTKPITQKLLKPVVLDDARSHLADRHCGELPKINTQSNQQAFNEHMLIDHTLLGHDHRD